MFKKFLGWVIRPSLISNKARFYNPFFDGVEIFKNTNKATNNISINKSDEDIERHFNEYKKMVADVEPMVRMKASGVATSLSWLNLILSLILLFSPVYVLKNTTLNTGVLFLDLIITEFYYLLIVPFQILSVVFFIYFLSYRWKSDLLSEPLSTCNFKVYLTSPSLWF